MKKLIPGILVLFFTIQLESQTVVLDTITSGGIERNYRMYIPSTYDGSEPVPLLFNLHGYSSDNVGQSLYANFSPVADTAGFILVLPNGTIDWLGYRFWNCFTSAGVGVDDVQFFSDLIDSLSAEYNIDPNRIYSTGMSNGGFMSHALACELSDRIAAIASVAGTIDKERLDDCAPTHNVPVMQIHGTADETVPYVDNISFFSVDSVVNYWVENNNCDPVPAYYEVPDVVTTDGCTAEHYVHSGCNRNSNVELFKIVGGGHTWPGTGLTFLGVTNLDISACAEIWKFLSRYRLDELTTVEEENEIVYPEISFYPNPVNSQINIQSGDLNTILQLEVYDMTGRNIFSLTDINKSVLSIETLNWPAGIYFLTLQTTGGRYSAQVVRN